jgi:C2 domain
MASEEQSQPSGETNGADSGPQDSQAQPQHINSQGKLAEAKEKLTATQQKIRDKNNPPGGYDDTPIPSAPDGYTVRFTFHRAENLPVSDFAGRSSDPYIHATLTSDLAKRHKEDPEMILRTPTIHKNVNPVWNTPWIVAGVPSSGFRLKCRLYDEDPSDHDDRLGNVTIYVDQLDGNWPGIREAGYSIKKRMGSKRAYFVRGCAAMLSRKVHMSGTLYLSAEVLGESEKPHGRMYTLGVTSWYKHYSPMIGRLAGTKAPGTTRGDEANMAQRYE